MQDLHSLASGFAAPGHGLSWLLLAIVVLAMVIPLAYILSRDPSGHQR